jgi:CDP-diacylglycerol--glycerol-3-phosphate 3-phosphatidyltransferase
VATTRAEYFARWSALHGGYDPASSPLVGRWLAIVHWCARPLAALQVRPAALTLVGMALSGGAAVAASGGPGRLYGAALLVLASGLVDSMDGAVALLTGRTSAVGSVLDSVADRCSDLLYLVALWRAGAPAGVCVGAGVMMFMHEYLRARASAAGMVGIGAVTVWERPTRVAVTAAALLGAAVFAGARLWSVPADLRWAAAGAWAWLALGVVGFVQLAVVVGRRLAGRAPGPTG